MFTLHIELTSLANSKLLNNDSRMFALCILKPRRVNTQMKIVWQSMYQNTGEYILCQFTELYLKSKLTKYDGVATRQKAEGSFNIITSEIVYD